MAFRIDEESAMDLEAELKKQPVPEEGNRYIDDADAAVELIAQLIKNGQRKSDFFQKEVEREINTIFSLFAEVSIENKLVFYERLMELAAKLSEIQKVRKIQNKAVVSFGGKVSAGKSRFINAISGIGDTLPIGQETTTAIQTYIIKADVNAISVNSIDGYTLKISPEGLNAMAHEFKDVYGFGLASFVDSIIVESKDYTLPSGIALLDTPGYTKYDFESNSKRVISDRERAYSQISASDYLIWLVDIESGAIMEDDIQFMESLHLKTPVLIVFTKADLKEDKEIAQIIDSAQETMTQSSVEFFGITAYSASMREEVNGDKIDKFFELALTNNVKTNDILKAFDGIEKNMRKEIEKMINENKKSSRSLFAYISRTDRIMDIRTLTSIWGEKNQTGFELNGLLRRYGERMEALRTRFKTVLGAGDLSND